MSSGSAPAPAALADAISHMLHLCETQNIRKACIDHAQAFDRVEAGYRGALYAEISPQTFPVLVRKGSRLNQLRVRRGTPQFTDTQLRRLHIESPLVSGTSWFMRPQTMHSASA